MIMNMSYITQKYEFTVVVPVFNLEKQIEYFHKSLVEKIKDMNYMIIYLDDCSVDNSFEILKSLSNNNRVVILKNDVNVGQHKSIIRGLKNINSEYAIIMDGDNQDDPKYVLELIEKYRNHPTKKAVFQILFKDFENKFKKINSILFYEISSFLFGIDKKKVANNFKLLNKELIKEIIQSNIKIVNLAILQSAEKLNYEYINIYGLKKERINDKKSSYSKIKLLKHLSFTYYEAFKLRKKRITLFFLATIFILYQLK